MKLLKSIIVAGSLTLSGLAMAEGGGDTTFNNMMQNKQSAVAGYALQEGKTAPVAKQYQYGMKLDIKKVVSIVATEQTCGVGTKQMTYKDSKGQLNAVDYLVYTDCRQSNG